MPRPRTRGRKSQKTLWHHLRYIYSASKKRGGADIGFNQVQMDAQTPDKKELWDKVRPTSVSTDIIITLVEEYFKKHEDERALYQEIEPGTTLQQRYCSERYKRSRRKEALESESSEDEDEEDGATEVPAGGCSRTRQPAC